MPAGHPIRCCAPWPTGWSDNEAYARKLTELTGAEFMIRERGGNYPFPGEDAFYYTQITGVPNIDAATVYPQVKGRPGGPLVFYVMQKNVEERGIEVRCSTPAKKLISNADREVIGIVVDTPNGERRIRTKKACHPRQRRVRGQPGDAKAVLANHAGDDGGQWRQYGRWYPNGAIAGR